MTHKPSRHSREKLVVGSAFFINVTLHDSPVTWTDSPGSGVIGRWSQCGDSLPLGLGAIELLDDKLWHSNNVILIQIQQDTNLKKPRPVP
ncbi:hypothetical protein Bpfe_010416 [Biomphalaria pfeifferi]|uniref:Uncharacterized protein n=1 Tax=Biomphalaria pfeifferi TaxID=112525 RepID=A0AAD8FEG9_BIOPF|nr:hypothetical protein Bpfe_010416 [Biomphalaria pfeifferi]